MNPFPLMERVVVEKVEVNDAIVKLSIERRPRVRSASAQGTRLACAAPGAMPFLRHAVQSARH